MNGDIRREAEVEMAWSLEGNGDLGPSPRLSPAETVLSPKSSHVRGARNALPRDHG